MINIHEPLAEFEFLRMWHAAEKKFNANEFIDAEEGWSLGHHYWNDHRADLVKNMMCLNLSLFGNFSNSGECTFYYFTSSLSLSAPYLDTLLGELFDNFGFNKKYISDLTRINDGLVTTEGNLMRIFVPKDKVDDYIYLSHAYGTPYRDKIDVSVFDSKKNRHTRISTILDRYSANPTSIADADRLQARVLLSQDCMLNPESGVKIFRYTTAKDNEMKKYKQAVKNVATEVFSNAVAQRTFKGIRNTKLEKLLSYVGKAGRV